MPQIQALNHVAIHVSDVKVSKDFYLNIMQLEEIPRPNFDFEGAWLKLGQNQELHLLGHRETPVYSGSRSNHFALAVNDIEEWNTYLLGTNIVFKTLKFRPDGLRHLFITDPDGHVIELFGV